MHIYQYVHHETDVEKMNKNIEIQSHFKDYLELKKLIQLKTINYIPKNLMQCLKKYMSMKAMMDTKNG